MRWIPRDEWDDAPDLGRRGRRFTPRHVVIHHTVGGDRRDTYEGHLDYVRRLRKGELRPDLGTDVPYNAIVGIGPGGEVWVFEGRGDRSGAHAKGYNTTTAGIAFIGDWHIAPAGDLEIAARAARFAAERMEELYGWNFTPPAPDKWAWGHRDIGQTTCPGKLILITSTTTTTKENIMRKGSKGEAVKIVQEALLRWDASSLPRYGADGVYGTETEEAVKRFQTELGLEPTGEVDGLTAALLVAVTSDKGTSDCLSPAAADARYVRKGTTIVL